MTIQINKTKNSFKTEIRFYVLQKHFNLLAIFFSGTSGNTKSSAISPVGTAGNVGAASAD